MAVLETPFTKLKRQQTPPLKISEAWATTVPSSNPVWSKAQEFDHLFVHLPFPLLALSSLNILSTCSVLDAEAKQEGRSDQLPLRKLAWGIGRDSCDVSTYSHEISL